MRIFSRLVFAGPTLMFLAGCSLCPCAGTGEPTVAFVSRDGELAITAGGNPVATYFYADQQTTRPYFAHLRAPCGIQVTRNHPPQAGDAQDHKTFHPGLWLAFGDIAGSDNWRLKAKVEGGEFVEAPRGGPGKGSFAVRNRYLANDGSRVICTETCRYTLVVRREGYLLIADSSFSSDTGDFYFGETMDEQGVSFRVATPMTVKAKQGGIITSDQGGVNEAGVRETLGYWADYSGTIGGVSVGITVLSDPKNGRRCWWHARDYGFLGANPFRSHPDRKDDSRVVVKKGETLRLRFGVWIHGDASLTPPDPEKAYADFLAVIAE